MLALGKYLQPINYHYRWNRFKNNLKLYKMMWPTIQNAELTNIWVPSSSPDILNDYIDIQDYPNFGKPISLNEVHWFKDIVSGYEFAPNRIDHLQIHDTFNKGIDIKFPWEFSRFYFSIKLANNYLISGKDKYFNTFKNLVSNFIMLNPFPYGIHWVSPMEVAIRAVNWIITVNLFADIFFCDNDFKEKITKSLLKHCEYLYNFPEVYYRNHTTNHTISNFAGLLFLALSFSKHSKSRKWLNKALSGLEQCVDYQIYDDGADFESSIPYHRLVLEMLSYSTIVAHSNNFTFSDNFYKKLFKMYEYTASYMDHNGNAPQIGDNDSGRFIILEQLSNFDRCLEDVDHSYLLTLGEHLFNYKFLSQCTKRDSILKTFLPKIRKRDVSDLTSPRFTDRSIIFNSAGAYFLKNNIFSLLVSCFPIGQNGKGGHNHLDNGSFTLSIKGKQAIVDPGTKTYTRSKNDRDKFRSYFYHNTLYTTDEQHHNLNGNAYWELKKYYNSTLIDFSENSLKIAISYMNDPITRYRLFSISNNILSICDEYKSNFFSRFNLHPDNQVLDYNNKSIYTKHFIIHFTDHSNYNIMNYDYSPHYDNIVTSKCIIVSATNSLNLYIEPQSIL